MRQLLSPILCIALTLGAAPGGAEEAEAQIRPVPRSAIIPKTVIPKTVIPKTQWDHRPAGAEWTRGALSALSQHGAPLVSAVPRDIASWCPGYATADAPRRRAFWVGFLSALAKHESTYRAKAVGGGGLWYGLLQILPGTARSYGCKARSGDALIDGASNLSCAIRIMARTVPRDGAIALREGRWSGVAADWGPLRDAQKRTEMAAWLRGQSYCAVSRSPRPPLRPETVEARRGAR